MNTKNVKSAMNALLGGGMLLAINSMAIDPANVNDKNSVRVVATAATPSLGVTTARASSTSSQQLNLGKGVGLAVVTVTDENGPLRKHDILTKLDDQVLVNNQQLHALTGQKKVGDEVKLTIFRDGKPETVSVKLVAGKAVVHQPWGQALPIQIGDLKGVANPEEIIAQLQEAFQGIDLQGGNAQVHSITIGGGADFTNLLGNVQAISSSTASMTEGDLSVTLTSNNAGKRLVAKRANGEVAYDGPVDTEAQRDKLPGDVRDLLERVEVNVSVTTLP